DVVLDIDGYFVAAPAPSALAFYPLTPCRVIDTRNPDSDLGGPYLQGHQERDFPVLEATSCNIPASAQAYSMNFTVVPKHILGYLTVSPTGQSRPVVSTLNDLTGTIVANAAIVPAGTGGDIAIYPSNDTDLVVDIDGYFAPPGTGGLSLYTFPPCRVLDTRTVGNGQPFSGTLSPPVNVAASPCAISSHAQAYVFNASVVPQGPLGYLTLWPDGQQRPLASTLNAMDGMITSNMAIVPTNNGKVDAYANGITQLILDISGYFAPYLKVAVKSADSHRQVEASKLHLPSSYHVVCWGTPTKRHFPTVSPQAVTQFTDKRGGLPLLSSVVCVRHSASYLPGGNSMQTSRPLLLMEIPAHASSP